MNNTFNLKRFGWYFKKHSIDHGRTYLLSLAVAIGIVFLALSLPAFIGPGVISGNYQYGIYLFLIWLGGGIFTSTIFADLGDRKKAILPLTLPVSHLEKFLVAWLYTFPIFLVVATCCFFAIDCLVVNMSHSTVIQEPNRLIKLTDEGTSGVLAITMFILFQIICFWGAIYFNKLHFIKSALVFFIAFLASTVLNKALIWLVSGGHFSSSGFFFQSDIIIAIKSTSYGLTLSKDIYAINWLIFALTMVLLWVSAFYKLKEKQV